MLDLSKQSNEWLLNNIWTYSLGSAPVGGYSIECYLRELASRDSMIRLYHSDQTVGERLQEAMDSKKKWHKWHY